MTPQEIAELRQKRYNATIVKMQRANPDLMILRVRTDFGRPQHKPGQYSTLGMGYWEPRFPSSQEEILKPGDETKLARRAYSISCSILDDDGKFLDIERTDWLEFYIVLVRKSEKPQAPALTPRLFMAEQGARIFLGEEITGNFPPDPVKPTAPILFPPPATRQTP